MRIKNGVQVVECKVATFLLVVTVEPQSGAELGRVLGLPGGQLPQLRGHMVTAVHSGATPLLRGFRRKNIFCQKIFDNIFSFQATEMVLTSKWSKIQQEIQI